MRLPSLLVVLLIVSAACHVAASEAKGEKQVYSVHVHDVQSGSRQQCVIEFLLDSQLLRKVARDAGIPDSHIITISPFSAKWLREIIERTDGFDPTIEGGPNADEIHTWSWVDPISRGAIAGGAALRSYYKLFFQENAPMDRTASTQENWQKVVAAFASKGVDLFEEFDYTGAAFHPDTIRSVLNGEPPTRATHCKADQCKVVARRDHGTTHVFFTQILHGGNPFVGVRTTDTVAKTSKVRLHEYDVYDLLPNDKATAFQLVDYAEESMSYVSFGRWGGDLPARDYANLFTTDVTNPAVRNGQIFVFSQACFSGSLMTHTFPPLSGKAKGASGRVSVIANRKKPYLETTEDKVLFLGFQDRYSVTGRNLVKSLATFMRIFHTAPQTTFRQLVSQARLQNRKQAIDFEGDEDPARVTPVVNFLQSHMDQLRLAYDKAFGEAKTTEGPSEFARTKEWLRGELKKLGWDKISLPKRISMVVALKGEVKRVRLESDDNGRLDVLGSKLRAWGNEQIYDSSLGEFFATNK